ncbi:MAG: alkaline phosphatase family protein [Candidatus Saccharibacteria bacterium]
MKLIVKFVKYKKGVSIMYGLSRKKLILIIISVLVVIGIIVAIVMALASKSSSTETSLAIDTYVNADQPGQQHDTESILKVNSDPESISFLQFGILNKATITKATLQLYATKDSKNGVGVYNLKSGQSLRDLTYSTRPVLGGKLSSVKSVSANSWVSLDVSAALKADGSYGFALKSNGSGQAEFDSSESGSKKPKLVVEYGGTKQTAGSSSSGSTKDTSTPTAPENLVATVADDQESIDLTWDASTSKTAVAHYNVYRDGSLIAVVPAPNTTYTDDDIDANGVYSYTVSATSDTLAESPLSDAANITVAYGGNSESTTGESDSDTPSDQGSGASSDGGNVPSDEDTNAPTAPSGLSATAVSKTQINLSWNGALDNIGIAGYQVFRNGSLVMSVDSSTHSWADGLVTPGTNYTYSVRAFDTNGNISEASNFATATTQGDLVSNEQPTADKPCGVTSSPPAQYRHVIWLWMENKKFPQVIGNKDAPYTTSLSKKCATASNYQDAGSKYNSLSNYIAATSGLDSCKGSCTATTWNDCSPSSSCQAPVDNLFRQVRAKGGSAKSYQESMPGNCTLGKSGKYAPKHNPAAYYTAGSDRQACQADSIPMGSTSSGALHSALQSEASFPTFSFLTPNLCNDTHDCSVATGDAWLKSWIPQILASPVYKSGSTVVFLMYDEDTPAPNVFMAPSIKPGTVSSSKSIGHYASLRTVEEMLGIPTHLGKASSAQSMRSVFNF